MVWRGSLGVSEAMVTDLIGFSYLHYERVL